jgi:hypothetical protein
MFLSLASFEHINTLSQHGVNGNQVRHQDLVVQIRVHWPAALKKDLLLRSVFQFLLAVARIEKLVSDHGARIRQLNFALLAPVAASVSSCLPHGKGEAAAAETPRPHPRRGASTACK